MLNPEKQPNPICGPTRYKKGPNKWELNCSVCGGIFYVDEITFAHVTSAMSKGGDNPFCCDDCEAEYDDVAH